MQFNAVILIHYRGNARFNMVSLQAYSYFIYLE